MREPDRPLPLERVRARRERAQQERREELLPRRAQRCRQRPQRRRQQPCRSLEAAVEARQVGLRRGDRGILDQLVDDAQVAPPAGRLERLGERYHERCDHVVQHGPAVALERIELRVARRVDASHVALDHRRDEACPVAEVVVHARRVALARGRRDLAQRHRVDAALGHQPLGGIEQLLASDRA